MNTKGLNRDLYSKRTLSTFNVVSAYIVDIYYNHLYIEAKKMKFDGHTTNISDGYRQCCAIFAKSFDDKSTKYRKKQYFRIIEGIKEYFTTYTSMQTLTVSECIHKIVSELVPEQFLRDLDNNKKSTIVRKCLVDAIMEFTKIAITDYIVPIIDAHDDKTNIEALQERMTDILLLEREKTQQLFLTSGKVETVDRSLAIRLQNDLKRMASLNSELAQRLHQTQQQLDMRTKPAQQLIDKTRLAYQKYNSLKAEYDELKDRATNIRQSVVEYDRPKYESHHPHGGHNTNNGYTDSGYVDGGYTDNMRARNDSPIDYNDHDGDNIIEEDPEDLEEYLNKAKQKINQNKAKQAAQANQPTNHTMNHTKQQANHTTNQQTNQQTNNTPRVEEIKQSNKQNKQEIIEQPKPKKRVTKPKKRIEEDDELVIDAESTEDKKDPIASRFESISQISKPIVKNVLGNAPDLSDIY